MEDSEEYGTGPFCRHWLDPSDCYVNCANCGHGCSRHSYEQPTECTDIGCNCVMWIEPDGIDY